MAIDANNPEIKCIAKDIRLARKTLKISIDQASEDTNIRKKYLKAIEAGDIAQIGFDVYYLGYLKTYANYLKLDYKKFEKALHIEKESKIKTLKSKNISSWEDFLPTNLVLYLSFLAFMILLFLFN